MRLPLPSLLYVTALGLFGWAGWTVYEMLPLYQPEVRDAASKKGIDDSTRLLLKGKGQSPTSADWNYSEERKNSWWNQLLGVNLIGKVEVVAAPKPAIDPAIVARQQLDATPLDEIIELVSLVYDSKGGGKGANTHVIVRYKTEDIEPPEWWVRENAPPTSGGGPRDIAARPPPVPVTRGGRGRNGNLGRPQGMSTTPMPSTSTTGREVLQKIWIDDEDPRRASSLWPNYEHIRLVRVAADAQSAFFVRDLPPVVEGQPAPEPKEEELLKTAMNLSQDVLRELRRLQGREGERSGDPVAPSPSVANSWREVEETSRLGNQWNIGRKDEGRFRDNADEFLNNVYADTYVSRQSSLRGLQVRSIEPQIAQRFGVVSGDVLLEINGRTVESKAQAMSQVKRDYQRGVRTFETKWLSNGQETVRVYQAPDK